MYLSIIILSLLGSIVSGFFGRKTGVRGAQIITSVSVIITTVLAVIAFFEVGFDEIILSVNLFKWVDSEWFNIIWEFQFNSLTVAMLIPVLVISSLVHIYSVGYMSEDPHNQRFFSYLSLFTFMMIILVTADNYLLMFVGWEGVGVCSYLLVSFWFTRIAANQSSMSAFLTNRVGDCFLTIGLFAILWSLGNLDYSTVFSLSPYINQDVIVIIGICLLIGAMAKSSQLGLHVWLPMAMEGPTPVSALIHAATMVTAGVYLLMRSSPLLEYSSTLLLLCLWLGAITTLFSSLVGLFQQDIKKVIAYSTMSQLGMMVIAIGLSSYNVALFHLVNHAFYKGLLFLGAGAVIHAVADNQDFRKYGGLISFLPLSYSVILIASLSLVAFPFMTGFYSKDFVLESAYGQYFFSGTTVYIIAVIGAIFTTLYSVKVLYLTFWTNPNGSIMYYKHAHEGNIFISLPLVILAIFSIFFGFITKDIFIGLGSNFFVNNSIFIHPIHEILINTEFAVPPLFKLLPFIFTVLFSIIAIIFSEYFSGHIVDFKLSTIGRTVFGFFNQRFLIELFYNKYITNLVLNLGGQTTKVLDKGSIEFLGPFGLGRGLIKLSKITTNLNKAIVTIYGLYIFTALIGLLFTHIFVDININLLIVIIILVFIFINLANITIENKHIPLQSNILKTFSFRILIRNLKKKIFSKEFIYKTCILIIFSYIGRGIFFMIWNVDVFKFPLESITLGFFSLFIVLRAMLSIIIDETFEINKNKMFMSIEDECKNKIKLSRSKPKISTISSMDDSSGSKPRDNPSGSESINNSSGSKSLNDHSKSKWSADNPFPYTNQYEPWHEPSTDTRWGYTSKYRRVTQEDILEKRRISKEQGVKFTYSSLGSGYAKKADALREARLKAEAMPIFGPPRPPVPTVAPSSNNLDIGVPLAEGVPADLFYKGSGWAGGKIPGTWRRDWSGKLQEHFDKPLKVTPLDHKVYNQWVYNSEHIREDQKHLWYLPDDYKELLPIKLTQRQMNPQHWFFTKNGVIVPGEQPNIQILLCCPNSYIPKQHIKLLPNTEAPYYNSYGQDKYKGLYDAPRKIQILGAPQPRINSNGQVIFPEAIQNLPNKYTNVMESFVYHNDKGRWAKLLLFADGQRSFEFYEDQGWSLPKFVNMNHSGPAPAPGNPNWVPRIPPVYGYAYVTKEGYITFYPGITKQFNFPGRPKLPWRSSFMRFGAPQPGADKGAGWWVMFGQPRENDPNRHLNINDIINGKIAGKQLQPYTDGPFKYDSGVTEKSFAYYTDNPTLNYDHLKKPKTKSSNIQYNSRLWEDIIKTVDENRLSDAAEPSKGKGKEKAVARADNLENVIKEPSTPEDDFPLITFTPINNPYYRGGGSSSAGPSNAGPSNIESNSRSWESLVRRVRERSPDNIGSSKRPRTSRDN